MGSIIKMDFYRFFRSVVLYVVIGVLIFTCATSIWSFYLITSPAMQELGAVLPEGFEELMPHSLDDCFNILFQSNTVVMFTVIFTVVFCNAEFKNGYIKNIASLVGNKGKLVFSKMLVILTAVIILHAALVLCIMVGCYGIMGLHEALNPSGIVTTVLLGLLMNMAIASLVYMLFMISRNAILPMVAGLVYVLMGNTLFSLVNLIMEKVFRIAEFHIEKYTTLGNMMMYVNSAADTSTYVRAAVISGVVLVATATVSCVLMQKKDVK